jgi:hypothetical protein
MLSQLYDLRESWTTDEFPGSMDILDVQLYNSLMPNGYHLHIVPEDDEVRVELYQYVEEPPEEVTG